MTNQTTLSNKTIVESIYSAFQRGDIPYILSQLDDNCVWNSMGAPQVPYGGEFKGKEIINFFQILSETLDISLFEPKEYIANEDGHVVAMGIFGGKGKKTGKNFEANWSMLWKFKNSKVVLFENYFDTAHVVAAL